MASFLSYHSLFMIISFTTLFSSTSFSSSIDGSVSLKDHEFLIKSTVLNKSEKLSHFHFYFHDVLSGKNQSAVQIIAAPNPGIGSGLFGRTLIIDDALTIGQDPKSKMIGKAQGFYSIASQTDVALIMVMSFVFLEGKYNGSALSILGRNLVPNDVRELPIVGGSGLFRFARGYALAHTVMSDATTFIVEYNLYVLHY